MGKMIEFSAQENHSGREGRVSVDSSMKTAAQSTATVKKRIGNNMKIVTVVYKVRVYTHVQQCIPCDFYDKMSKS